MPDTGQGILPRFLTGAALAAGLGLPAGAIELKASREEWTVDQLEQVFLAEHGEDVARCYGDYAFAAGPDAPGRKPESCGERCLYTHIPAPEP